MMEIIVPHKIRKRELGGAVSEEAQKIFAKLKERPAIAAEIGAPGLPSRTTLHKVYATAANGARRLLFFCRHAAATSVPGPERWVLIFYRDKSDSIGKNMSPKNPDFRAQLATNLQHAFDDLAASTPTAPKFERF